MAAIDLSSGKTILSTGLLQLENGVAMSTTLTSVTDQSNTASQLKLSTTLTQVAGTLQIHTDTATYIDAEDGSGNNRFTISRDPASQQVNVDFASNPTGSTTIVGAIRTYVDGTNLSEVMTFREDGNIGIGTTNPIRTLDVQASQSVIKSTSTTMTNSAGLCVTNTSTSRDFWFGRDSSVGNGFGMASPAYAGVINARGAYPLYIGANDLNILSLLSDGKVGVNQTSPTSQLQIKGSGSTSATTSLLVQNSAGDQIFKIQDDGSSNFGRSGNNSTATFYGLSGLQCIIGNDYLQSPSNITRVTGGQLTLFGRNNNGNAFSFEHLNSQQSNASGISMVNIGGGYATQQNATFSSLQIAPSYDLDSNTTTNSIARGIYYNPTITNLRTAKHYGIQTTSGGAYINTTTPQDSACLQADSTTQGFLPPRMTTAQRTAIATPAVGLMVYCTDAVEGLYVYKSTGWTFVI